jgi:hypothetical protein
MTLEQWALVAEIVAAVAVIASLLFLAVEVRRNTAEAKRTNWESAIDRFKALWSRTSRDDLAEIIERGRKDYAGLSGSEKIVFGHYFFELCLTYEVMIVQGLDQIQGGDLEGLPHKHLQYQFSFPGTRQWWGEMSATQGLSPIMNEAVANAIEKGELRSA